MSPSDEAELLHQFVKGMLRHWTKYDSNLIFLIDSCSQLIYEHMSCSILDFAYICAKNRKNPSSHPACRTIENESSMKPKPRSYIVCKMLLLWWHVAGLFHWRGSLRNPWWIIYKVMWSLWGSLLSGKIIMAERREDVWKVWMVLSAERHDQHIWTLCCTEWIWSSRRLYSFSSQEHSNVGQKSLRSNRERMSGHRVYFSRGSDVWVAHWT